MTETEWRNLGVQQSPGWVHYMMHTPGTVKKIVYLFASNKFSISLKAITYLKCVSGEYPTKCFLVSFF
jgi:hypothetical protein